MSSETNPKPLYENLDTTFVNLWSLLRNLTQRGFIGRVRVELQDYSADILMTGSSTPLVQEIDRTGGVEQRKEGALHRLVLRAGETPGTINVYEGPSESARRPAPTTHNPAPPPRAVTERGNVSPPGDLQTGAERETFSFEVESPAERSIPPVPRHDESSPDAASEADVPTATMIAGELIAAVERALRAAGADFDSLFHTTRIELADDYSFLDPLSSDFTYANGAVTLDDRVPSGSLTSGLSEALRRLTDKVAVGDRERRVRERVALELLSVGRRRKRALEHTGFHQHLDRIAGTKVM
jgi:hypothetical protein